MNDKIVGLQECIEHISTMISNAQELEVQDLKAIMHEASMVLHEMSLAVHEMSCVANTMVEEYTKQIGALQTVRDEQLKIIREQNKAIASLQEDIRNERTRTHTIIDKVLLTHSTNVNVH